MEPPEIPAWEEIQELLSKIEEANSILEAHYKRLNEFVSNLSSAIPNREELVNLSTYLYWMIPEVSPNSLAIAVTGDQNIQKLLKYLPAITVGLICDRCETQIQIKSRTRFHQILRDKRRREKDEHYLPRRFAVLCDTCRNQPF
ncbi:MAG: hypothetical protein KIT70_04485 [Anaerolineales bacterium]|nr:MAG: hypothetical protein KIT70_04485 [Anaerolineales bacterium]